MKRKLRRRLEVLVHRCCPCPISSERRRGFPPFSGRTRHQMPLCRSFLPAAAASSIVNLRQERTLAVSSSIYIISNAPAVFIQYSISRVGSHNSICRSCCIYPIATSEFDKLRLNVRLTDTMNHQTNSCNANCYRSARIQKVGKLKHTPVIR